MPELLAKLRKVCRVLLRGLAKGIGGIEDERLRLRLIEFGLSAGILGTQSEYKPTE